MPLHLIKLAVGIDDVEHLRRVRAARAAERGGGWVYTRNRPRREAEVLDGGSIYWVIAGVISVRQRIADIREAKQPDGTRCTDLVLHRTLVPVRGRFMKPFQGWRYLAASDAPPDESTTTATTADLPDRLRRELAALALL